MAAKSEKPKWTAAQVNEHIERIQKAVEEHKRACKSEHFTAVTPEEVEKKLDLAKKWAMQHSNIVFASDGEGLGKDAVMVSVHRDYSKYADFMRGVSRSIDDSKLPSGSDRYFVAVVH